MAGVNELKLFHKPERNMFQRLVLDLGQEAICMRWVIALWLYLESVGHEDFIQRLAAMPGPVVGRFVQEAMSILAVLADRVLPGACTRLPCTNALLARPIDGVGYFEEHRDVVLSGVNPLYKDICCVVLDDDLIADADALLLPATEADLFRDDAAVDVVRATAGQPVAAAGFAAGGHAAVGAAAPVPATRMSTLRAAAEPWCPAPTQVMPEWQLPARMAPMPVPEWQPVRMAPVQVPVQDWQPVPVPVQMPAEPVQEWQPAPLQMPVPDWQQVLPVEPPVPEDHRSLFATFSRGYPISKEEILDFFETGFGPCVEDVKMERPAEGQTPMYARVVLRSQDMIPLVLEGNQTAKYVINKRHLWLRVYVPNNRHSSSSLHD